MATATKTTAKDVAYRVIGLMDRGKLDRYLEMILQAAIARQRVIRDQQARLNMLELNEIGKRLRVTAKVRPKYLAGMEGTVVAKPVGFRGGDGKDYIYVELDHKPSGKYGKVIGFPANLLEEA